MDNETVRKLVMNMPARVRQLKLAGGTITAEGAAAVARALQRQPQRKLRSLDISLNHIGDHGVAFLLSASSKGDIESLQVGDNGLPTAGLLTKRALNTSRLSAFSLSNSSLDNTRHNKVGIEVLGSLSCAMRRSTSVLASLGLRGNSIAAGEGVDLLAAGIRHSATVLTELDVSCNPLGNQAAQKLGVAFLEKAAESASQLCHTHEESWKLKMACAGAADTCALALAKYFRDILLNCCRNQATQHFELDLYGNPINDEGAATLVYAAKDAASISSNLSINLDLGCTNVTNMFVPALTTFFDTAIRCRQFVLGLCFTALPADFLIELHAITRTETTILLETVGAGYCQRSKDWQPVEQDYRDEKREKTYQSCINSNPTWQSSRRRPLCDHRASILRLWLIQQFGGLTQLRKRGVLDIGGGRGELAYELWNKHGIPSCVVDPRATKLKGIQLNHLGHCGVFRHAYAKSTAVYDDHCCTNISARHTDAKSMPLLLQSSFSPVMCPTREHGSTPTNLDSAATVVRDWISHGAILIGMHACQATEAIIDASLQYSMGLPFAVVPCCPPRRASSNLCRSGDCVTTAREDFSSFLTRLIAKVKRSASHSSLKVSKLGEFCPDNDFGKFDTVIWCCPYNEQASA